VSWDPKQYGRYAAERRRPFVDLLARVGAVAPRRVIDLGCGTGSTTALLAARWPDAQVEGIDSSPEMIAAAPSAPGLSFRVGDVASWQSSPDVDVIVSNATLHWVSSHRSLVAQWSAALPEGGWIAFQVPGNFGSPSHALLRALADSSQWADLLAGVLQHEYVGTPVEYAHLLLSAGLVADVWETTYLHVLSGPDAVLEWLRGTALRPVMAALSESMYGDFEAELAGQLRTAYPPSEHGTLFAFRRIFAVATRPAIS
jgi:trans-aconitate 2-methyltransferase